MPTPEHICMQLNKLIDVAPQTAHALVEVRFQYKGSLDVDLPMIVFDDHKQKMDSPTRFTLGMLGVINGFIAGEGKVIQAAFDKKSGKLLRFALRDK